jgi:TetR/AcrR family transcriptional regulator, transcriptional repressor for nem operon
VLRSELSGVIDFLVLNPYCLFMARPREFDNDDVLDRAIEVFSNRGYEGTSTSSLLEGMGISRQSLYGAFGDKKRLYLEALQRYTAQSVAEMIGTMNSKASPIEGIEAGLMAFASRPPAQSQLSCLGVSASCEFGQSDPDVNFVLKTSGRTLLSAFESLLSRAKIANEVAPDLEVREAAVYLRSTLSGMKVSARGGAPPETLRAIARLALRSLR